MKKYKLYIKEADGSYNKLLDYKIGETNSTTLICAANNQKKVEIEFYKIMNNKKSKAKLVGKITFKNIDSDKSEIKLESSVKKNGKIEIKASESSTGAETNIEIQKLNTTNSTIVLTVICSILLATLLALFILFFFGLKCERGHSYFKELKIQKNIEEEIFTQEFEKEEIKKNDIEKEIKEDIEIVETIPLEEIIEPTEPEIIEPEPNITEETSKEIIIETPIEKDNTAEQNATTLEENKEENKIEIVEETPEYTKYRLKYGDTLWDLADKYYDNPFDFNEIAKLNNIKNPDKIYADTIIEVPKKK